MLLHRQRTVTFEDRFERQPTPFLKGQGVVLFDGRLDDRIGLSRELGLDSQQDVPDSVLVGHAFEKWGQEAPLHLLGDHALVILDQRNRCLIMAVDPKGTRTLYFYRQQNLISFSTVLPALLNLEGVPREIDEGAVADLLINNFRDNRASFYRGITRVLGGETVVCTHGKERLLDHWPLYNVNALRLKNDNEYLEAGSEVLDQAVRSAMRSTTPVPLMGSGGLDSSCLAVSALRVNGGSDLPVFTMVPESGATAIARTGHYASERRLVEAMQTSFPRLLPHFIQPAQYPDVAFAPERVFEETAVPLRVVVSLGWTEAVYKAMQSFGANSYLEGGGGNFTFTWDGLRSLSSLFRTGQWFQLGQELGALGRFHPRRTAAYLWKEVLKPSLPRSCRQGDWERYSTLQRDAAARLDITARIQASGHDPSYAVSSDRKTWLKHVLTTNRTFISEASSWVRARYGLEVRRPLLDIRVIRFCMSLPENQFLRKGQTRWFARRFLTQAGAPEEVSRGTARGLWCPEWFTQMNRRKDQLPQTIAALRQSSIASRLIDIDRVSNIVADWPSNAEAADSRRLELDTVLTRALHVGAFLQWAEAKNKPTLQESSQPEIENRVSAE